MAILVQPQVAVICTLGWCELKLYLKNRNPQADYGSMFVPEKLLSTVFGHRMYQFLRNWPFKNRHIQIVKMAWK